MTVDGSVSSTLTLYPGDDVLLVRPTNSGYWFAQGSAALGKASGFGSSFLTSGYQKLPSGLIIQWGQNSTNSSGIATMTLPITFPNALLSANCNYLCSGSGMGPVAQISNSSTKSVLSANCWTSNTLAVSGPGANIWFIAIGY
jgi:hypothetical protein